MNKNSKKTEKNTILSKGRPPKYTDKMPLKVLQYLEKCKDEETEFHKTRGEKSDSFERIIKVNLPTTYGLARFLGVHRDTILDWVKKYKNFSYSYEQFLTEQHDRIVNYGLAGQYNANIVKLMLMNNFDYKEKSDMTSDNERLPQPILGFIKEDGTIIQKQDEDNEEE